MVTVLHNSDCAVHNEPVYPNGPCDCGADHLKGSMIYEMGLKLGSAEYERDKYKATLERIANENQPHTPQGNGLSDFGGNADDLADDVVATACGKIGDLARQALHKR